MTLRSSRKRSNKNKILIAGGAVLLIVILLFVYLFFFTSVFGSRSQVAEAPIPAAAKVQASDDGLYYLEGTTLVHTDFEGKERWTSKFSTGALSLAVGDELICVYDENTATILSPEKQSLFVVPHSEFQLLDAACGTSSVAFLSQLREEPDAQYLRVFDSTGTEIYRTEIISDEILKYGLNSAGDSLWMLTLDTTGAAPISRVTTMNPAQKKLTGNVDVSDQLIENVYFSPSDMFLSGTSNLTRYNNFGEKLSETLVYGQRCVDNIRTDDKAVFVYIPRSTAAGESSYTVRTISFSGDAALSDEALIQLPKGIQHYAVTGSRLYCFSENTIYVYALSGEFAEQIPLEGKLTGVTKLNGSLALLRMGGRSYFLPLQ